MSKKLDRSFVDNLIGHNFGRGIYISKEDLSNMVDITSKYIKSSIIPIIKELSNIVKSEEDKAKIVSSLAYRNLGFKNDLELLDAVNKLANEYVKNSTEIKNKIDELVSDYISVNTSNINHKLLLAVIGLGAFMSYSLPSIISYWITRYYLGYNTSDYKKAASYSISLAEILTNLKKVKLKDILDSVGKFPTLRANKNEIPSQIVLGFAKKNLKINNKYVLSFIGKALNLLKRDTRAKANRNNQQSKNLIGSTGFIGNPIYHIRLLLTDWEVNRYKKLEDEKRLLELKLAEVKAKQQGIDDPKIRQQIEYYEKEIKRIEDKLDVILKDANLNRKNQ